MYCSVGKHLEMIYCSVGKHLEKMYFV
jgi:hypothetical protein